MSKEILKPFRRLTDFRVAAGFNPAQVEKELIVGRGWVERFESGEVETPFSALVAMLNLYGRSLTDFYEGVDLRSTDVVIERHLTARPSGADIVLTFPMGKFAADVTIPKATMDEFESVLAAFREVTAQDNGNSDGIKQQAIVACFLKAVDVWPHANPSDLWYFLVSHIYQDDLNHAASAAGRDWSQSWKRAGGWSLESIFVNHYNPYLRTQGVRLAMPSPDEKKQMLRSMGIAGDAAVEKSDVMVLGRHADGTEQAFGVVHVKASFAERRTDDAPLSQKLIAGNFASPLVTMDCKANPGERPINKGELGPVQGGPRRVSSKRLDIERDRVFDVAFSYNANTLPTPDGAATAARVHVCSFADPADRFATYLIRKWRERQGLD